MVEYNCERCKKVFTHKGTYVRHKNKKNMCKNIVQIGKKTIKVAEKVIFSVEYANYIIKKDQLTCDFCNKTYKRTYDLQRHIKLGCKMITHNIHDKQENLPNQSVLEEIKILKEKIKELEKKTLCPTINNVINNNTQTINNIRQNNIQQNSIQQIVQVNPFGKEQIDITDKQLIKLLRKCCNSVPELINFKHFNKNMPENSNVYIPNVKATHVKVFTGDKWEIRDTNDIVHQLYEDNNDYLMEQFEDKKNELDELTVRKFNTYVSRVDEEKTVKHVKKSIKQNLYNNKDIPLAVNKHIDK
jgi:uncharacterized C2H2 Zn-finger protein